MRKINLLKLDLRCRQLMKKREEEVLERFFSPMNHSFASNASAPVTISAYSSYTEAVPRLISRHIFMVAVRTLHLRCSSSIVSTV